MNEEQSELTAARCYEIQTALDQHEVPDFDAITRIGMAARMALHIQGLPLIDYSILKPVCAHFLGMSPLEVESTVKLLAEIEFVRIDQAGKNIKTVLPTVPYYGELYKGLGEYMNTESNVSEIEQLALAVVDRLAKAPDNADRLQNDLGVDSRLFKRTIDIGEQGNFLIIRRCRSRDIVINPSYFAENTKIFADHVASTGAKSVAQILQGLRQYQGWPLSLIESSAKLGGTIDISTDQVSLLQRLAQDGIVKPPSIETAHAGRNYFMFTPTPSADVYLSPTKRDVYEKAMAIVAAIRQGQLLPKKYAIRSPGAVLYKLKTELRLGKATTEFKHQYQNLVHLRIGRLVAVGQGFYEFQIIDTQDNREALDIAYSLVSGEPISHSISIDEAARKALQSDQNYIDSIISRTTLQRRETVSLSEEQREEYESLLLAGVK